MKTVILAGGDGTRLRPITATVPKPMVNLLNKPLLQHIIERLERNGFDDILITLKYMPDTIIDYFGSGEKYGVKISYFTENIQLGTAGSVRNALGDYKGDILVVSGDGLCDIDFEKFYDFHKKNDGDVSIALAESDRPVDYGVVIVENNRLIKAFEEKPDWSKISGDTVNTGIYFITDKALKDIPFDTEYDFAKDLFPKLLSDGIKMYGYDAECYWCDIGDSGAFLKATREALEGKIILNQIHNGNKSDIAENVQLISPFIIGENTVIREGTVIGPYTVIGKDCIIGEACELTNTVLFDGVRVLSDTKINGSIICERTTVMNDSVICTGTVIGANSLIGSGSYITPGIKLANDSIIENGTKVTMNLIQSKEFAKGYWDSGMIKGELNVEITPEYCVKVGLAVATFFGNNNKIAVATDFGRKSQMIEKSIISGILSSGCDVLNCGMCILPVERYVTDYMNCSGGIYICESSDNKYKTEIHVLTSSGNSIVSSDARVIDNIIKRDTFYRCDSEKIGNVLDFKEGNTIYKRAVLNRRKNKKDIALAFHTPNAMSVKDFTGIFNDFGIHILPVIGGSINDFGVMSAFKMKTDKFDVDFGVSMDVTCNKIKIVLKDGKVIDNERFAAIVVYIDSLSNYNKSYYIPTDYSNQFDAVVNDNYCIRNGVLTNGFINNLSGGFASDVECGAYVTAFSDVLSALMGIINYLNSQKITLAELNNSIPEFTTVRDEMDVSDEKKGKIVRLLREKYPESTVGDGVRISTGKGWIIVVPDNVRPVCRITAEGLNSEFSKELYSEIFDFIRDI